MAKSKNVSHYTGALDLDRIGKIHVDITEFEETAAKLQEQADRAKIVDKETYAKGGDLIAITRRQAAKADELRKKLGTPFFQMHKFINGAFKPVETKFDAIRATVEKKMLVWKRAEDKRLRAEAEEKARRIEEEALEQATDDNELNEENLEAAIVAAQRTIEQGKVGVARGNYGSSTGSTKKYRTEVMNLHNFLTALPAMVDELTGIELAEIVELRKSGLNKLAQLMLKRGIESVGSAKFIEEESLRVR